MGVRSVQTVKNSHTLPVLSTVVELLVLTYVQVSQLSVLGGSDNKETVHRLLRAVVTVELSQKVNWSGKGGKNKTAFQSLNMLCSVLLSEYCYLEALLVSLLLFQLRTAVMKCPWHSASTVQVVVFWG